MKKHKKQVEEKRKQFEAERKRQTEGEGAARFACYADTIFQSVREPRAVIGHPGYVLAMGWIGDDRGRVRPVFVHVRDITACAVVDCDRRRLADWPCEHVRLSFKRDAGLPDSVTIAVSFGDLTAALVDARKEGPK